jgi:ABC-type sugar transport system ATPase subunit
MASIELRSVTKRFDQGVVAVDNVDLEIADGEFMIFLGPSGCGKSTTLRMIAGLETISDGDLLIDGAQVNDVDPADRDLAIVFQNYALYPHMSVRGNLAFGLELRRMARAEIERRIAEVAAMLDIQPLLDRKPSQLSGGQRQRVAVGRALVREPKAFLLDEPLSNLDAKLRAQMRSELVQLHKRLGTTIIHVTHDQVEAMTMGDRICIMKDGKAVQVGRPLDVYHNPADTFVAGFLANPPMNLIPAVLAADGGDPVAAIGELRLPLTPSAGLPAAGAAITLGIQPHDLRLEPGSDSVPLPCRLDAVEALGPETILMAHLRAEGDPAIAARLPQNIAIEPGADLGLHADPRSFYLFDAESGKALRPA